MNNEPIVQLGNPVLRERAREIMLDEFGSPYITEILSRMHHTLSQAEDGVALAAPQIGESLRIFIIAEKAYKIEEKTTGHTVFINPQITKTSKEKAELEEGCLSVRGKFGHIIRAEKVTVEAYDESAKKFTVGFSGLLAQIAQHEIDHLEGKLFIDEAYDIQQVEGGEEDLGM